MVISLANTTNGVSVWTITKINLLIVLYIFVVVQMNFHFNLARLYINRNRMILNMFFSAAMKVSPSLYLLAAAALFMRLSWLTQLVKAIHIRLCSAFVIHMACAFTEKRWEKRGISKLDLC